MGGVLVPRGQGTPAAPVERDARQATPPSPWGAGELIVTVAGPPLLGYTLGGNAKRVHVWRFLNYLTTAGVSGLLTYTGGTITLPDTGGVWSTYDLGQSATLAYGLEYTQSSVIAAFESVS